MEPETAPTLDIYLRLIQQTPTWQTHAVWYGAGLVALWIALVVARNTTGWRRWIKVTTAAVTIGTFVAGIVVTWTADQHLRDCVGCAVALYAYQAEGLHAIEEPHLTRLGTPTPTARFTAANSYDGTIQDATVTWTTPPAGTHLTDRTDLSHLVQLATVPNRELTGFDTSTQPSLLLCGDPQ